MHGGKSTGPPKGTRNAVKHGAYVADPVFTIDDEDAAIQARAEATDLTDPARIIRRSMVGADRMERAFVSGQIDAKTYIEGRTRFDRSALAAMAMLRAEKGAALMDRAGVTIDFGYFPPAEEPPGAAGSADAAEPAPDDDAPTGEPV